MPHGPEHGRPRPPAEQGSGSGSDSARNAGTLPTPTSAGHGPRRGGEGADLRGEARATAVFGALALVAGTAALSALLSLGGRGALGPAGNVAVFVLLTTLAGLTCLQRGRPRLASGALLFSVSGAGLAGVLMGGSVDSAGLAAVVLAAGLAGLLLSPPRAALVGVAWSALLLLLHLTVLESTPANPAVHPLWWLPLPVLAALLPALVAGRTRAALDLSLRHERQLARQASELEASQARYRGLIETAPLGVLVADPELVAQIANEEMAKLVGAPSVNSMVGRNLRDLPVWALPDIRAGFERVLAGERVTLEASWKTAWGREVVGRFHGAPLRGDDGRVLAAQVIAEDLSEERALRERLDQARRLEALGQLAGGVAHDFNNYLTAILGNAELLASELPPEDPRSELVAGITRAAEHSAALTRKLLAFGRRQVFQARVMDPARLLRELAPVLRRLAGEAIQFDLDCAEDTGRVRADPLQLEVALVNLVSNARDAMPEGGTLTLETGNVLVDDASARRLGVPPGAYVSISVSDTGSGMPPEVRDRIFEPFFTTKPEGEGTGLGLSSVHGIVRQSGGAISVYSEPGVGTLFRIYLPWVDEPEAEPVSAGAGVDLRGSETVLLVEDDPEVRQVARAALTRAGYEVIEAPDGVRALELAAGLESPPDLLLSDLVMPGMGGGELSRRARERWPGLRVLFVSGYSANGMVRRGALEPGVELLQKPFTPRELLRRVRACLDRPAPGRQEP